MTILTITCDDCAMQHTDVCDDCVVTFLCAHDPEEAIVFELTETELRQLAQAGESDWQFIEPSIMGTLFERALDEDQRSQLGAHYTSEVDIKTLPCRVARLVPLAPDVMQVFLRLPAVERLSFHPGQYLDILLDGGRRRSFSIASVDIPNGFTSSPERSSLSPTNVDEWKSGISGAAWTTRFSTSRYAFIRRSEFAVLCATSRSESTVRSANRK